MDLKEHQGGGQRSARDLSDNCCCAFMLNNYYDVIVIIVTVTHDNFNPMFDNMLMN